VSYATTKNTESFSEEDDESELESIEDELEESTELEDDSEERDERSEDDEEEDDKLNGADELEDSSGSDSELSLDVELESIEDELLLEELEKSSNPPSNLITPDHPTS
jgi:hypothetical protein